MALSMTTTRASDLNSLKLKVPPSDRVISDHAEMPKNVHLVRKLSGDGEYGAVFRVQDFESVTSDKGNDSAMQSEEDMSRKLLRGGQ